MRFAKTTLHLGLSTLFLLAIALAALVNYRTFEQKRDAYYARLLGELHTAYGVTICDHQDTARSAFDTYINQPEFLKLYRQANSADEAVRTAVRRQLLAKLGPLYEWLKLRDVKQFHFHLPNSESFLRFHRPEQYGDSLKGLRYSVDKANAELVAVSGFEVGRFENGFRNVFPLMYNGEHLGSVEISMGFDAARRRMEQQFHNRYAFMVRRRLVEDTVFTEEEGNYQPSDLSDDYLYEQSYAADDTLRAINAILKPEIQESLRIGEGFALEAKGLDAERLVVFFPVEDIKGQHVAYIVSYNDDATIRGYYSEFIGTLGLSIAGILVIVLLIYHLTNALRRVRSEKKNLQQERDMFASGSVVVFKWQNRENWPVEYLSANTEELLGYTASDFLSGQVRYADIVHPGDISRVVEEVKIYSENQVQRFEHKPYRLIRANNEVIWVLDYTTIVRDGAGNITHYLGYLVDVTELKKTEEALRISEERLNLALKGAELGMWDWHIPTGEHVINERWAQMLGYALDEIEPNVGSWEKLIHPDDMESVNAVLTDHLEGRSPVYQTEYRLRDKSGEWKWILGTGKVLERDKDGKPVRMLGIHQDISGRKELEDSLKKREEQLRTLINSTPDIICFKDGQGRWLVANDADLELFQLDNVDYQGKKDSDLAKYSEFYYDAFMSCENTDEISWQKGTLSRCIEIIPRPDGSQRIYDVIKVPLFEDDGLRKGLVVLGRDITEIKMAEEQLHNEREKLFVTLRSIGDGVITTDTEGRITSINGVAEELTGWNQEAATAQPLARVFNIINETTGEPVENTVKRVLDSGTIIGLANHTALIARDGSRRSIADSGAPIIDAQGKIIGVVLVFRDVTEKKIREEALKEKERFLQTIFDGIQDPMHVIDRNYKVLLTNKKLLELKNVKQEDIRGKYCYEAYQGRNAWCEQCGAKEVFKTGKPCSLLKSLPLPDGTYGYFEVYSFPLLEESGEVIQVIELTRDITNRERALREMRKMTRIVEQAAEAVAVTDTEGKIEYVNATFENITGYSLDEVKGKNLRILKGGSPKPELYKELWESITKGGIWRGQFINKKKNGSEYYEETVIFPIKDEGGTITHYTKIARDITKEKEAEEKLRHSLEEKEVLLREVNHRVKNNLNIVSSLLNLQADTIHSPEQALAGLRHSRDRIMAMALVHEELYTSQDYAEVDMGRYLRELVDNLGLVYSADNRIRIVVEASGVTLSLNTSIPCGLIITELITNAFKYAFPEDRNGTIRVTLSRPTEVRVLMEVSDDGVGLPKPFAELGGDPGASLGLSLVRILVEQLGGTLEVTSAQGTAYRIEFPDAVKPVESTMPSG